MTLTVPPAQVARLLDAMEHLQIPEARQALVSAGELTAVRTQLRELLLVAIDEAAEGLSAQCTALLRGSGSAAQVRAGVDEVSALLDLLASVDQPSSL
jgi:hypothetical protein